MDGTTASVVGLLETAGVPVLVLKGASFGFLYGDGRRAYVDVDVLIPPSSYALASETLASAGFRRTGQGLAPSEAAAHSQTWLRPDTPELDLHLAVPGVGLDAEDAFARLYSSTTTMRIADRACRVLDDGARRLHVVLHAAQGGRANVKSTDDLERLADQLTADGWEDVLRSAEELDAVEAFTAGLLVIDRGRAILDALRLEPSLSVERRAMLVYGSGPEVSLGRAFSGTLRQRVAVVTRTLVPTRSGMAARSRLARRGGPWVAVAYLARPFVLLARLPGVAVRVARASATR